MDVTRTAVVVDAPAAAAHLPSIGVGIRTHCAVCGVAASLWTPHDVARRSHGPVRARTATSATERVALDKRGAATAIEAAIEYARIANDGAGAEANIVAVHCVGRAPPTRTNAAAADDDSALARVRCSAP